MILPVVLYRIPEDLSERIFKALQPVCAQLNTYLRVIMRTERHQEAAKGMMSAGGIALLIAGVSDSQQDGLHALQLGRYAMTQNRDSYVIYCAREARTMISMAPYCMRPVAIVTEEILEAQAVRIFRDILTDFSRLHTDSEEGKWISVKEKVALKRINLNDLCVVMAANKAVELHLLREKVVTHDSLENFNSRLDERFVRCHRSCIINTKLIQQVNFRTMTITMMNGMEIPLSRTYRQDMQEWLDAAVGEEEA